MTDTSRECTALVPYVPPAPPRRRTAFSRLITFVCALFCLITVTLGGINVALIASTLTPESFLLRLADGAFFGVYTLSVQKESADTPPFPPADTDAALPPTPPPDTSDAAETTDTPDDEPPAPTAYPIEIADVSAGGNLHLLYNETAYTPDITSLIERPLATLTLREVAARYGTDAPYVLIVHTHGTEAYAAQGADTYTTEDTFRSSDTEENVVAVGAVMAETLEAAGIPTLHCTEMFDEISYQDSYNRSAAAVRSYLAAYPSVQVVLDVHRDSLIRADMTKIRPVTTIGGEEVAQFMIVAGTDYKGADHPNWQENLSFALKIQADLAERTPHFARAINLRGAAFNQQYTAGSLLLEVGSCGNTLAQAKRAGALAAEAIASVLKEASKTDKTTLLTLVQRPHAG